MGHHDAGGSDGELGHALGDHPGPDGRALLVTGAAAQRDPGRDAGGLDASAGHHTGLPGGNADGGRRSRPMPYSARMVSLQSSFSMSIIPFRVSDAGSVTHSSAPMRYRKYSWPLANQRVCSNSFGSLSRSQATFAADHSGESCMPVWVW